MLRELIDLLGPVLLVAAGGAIILLILLGVLLLRSRRRKREHEAEVRAELLLMEREAQFAAGAEQIQYRSSSSDVIDEVATLFSEHLSIDLIAVYSGREEEENLKNILRTDLVGSMGPELAVPESLPASVLREYWRPQLTRLNALVGGGIEAMPPGETINSETEGTPGDETERAPGSDQRTAVTGRGTPNDVGIAILPWQGPFGWNGLMIGRVNDVVRPEALARYREILARIGERLAIALELTRSAVRAESSGLRAVRTFDFCRSLTRSLDEPTPLNTIVSEVASFVGAESAALWRVDPASSMLRMAASHGLRSTEFLPLPQGQGLAGHIINTGASLALENAPTDPRCLFPREARESGIVAYLGVPVLGAHEQPVGVLEVHTSKPRVWTDEDRQALESAAGLIAGFLKSNDTRGTRLKVEGAYLGLSEALHRLRSRDEVMQAAVELLGHALGVSRAVAIEVGKGPAAVTAKHEYHAPGVQPLTGTALGSGIVDRFEELSENGELLAVSDSRERSLMGAQITADLRVQSELAVPIKQQGKIIAILCLHQVDRAREWQADEVQFAERVGRQLSLSLENVLLFESAARDVASVRAEIERAAEEASRIQAILNAHPETVIGLDMEGRVTFFNPAARDKLGLGNDDLGRMAGMTEALTMSDDTIWDRVNSCEGVTRFEAELTRLIASSQTTSGSLSGGFITQAPTPIPVSVAVAPLKSNSGHTTGHLVVMSDLSHVNKESVKAAAQLAELEPKLAQLDTSLSEVRQAEQQARVLLEQARTAEASIRAEAESLRSVLAELKQERDQARADEVQVRRSSQQLLEINRLKSEFIVNAGREIEASLQSILGFTEQLNQGTYGPLLGEQVQAVRSIFAWSKRIQEDVESMIDYGSTRSRRLESSEERRD